MMPLEDDDNFSDHVDVSDDGDVVLTGNNVYEDVNDDGEEDDD